MPAGRRRRSVYEVLIAPNATHTERRNFGGLNLEEKMTTTTTMKKKEKKVFFSCEYKGNRSCHHLLSLLDRSS